MSHHSAIKRPRAKLWQFSIANLLVAISLVAVTCGAFRVDISLGLCLLHLKAAIAITAVRTRAAVGHHEELWNALGRSNSARRSETVDLAIRSFGVSLAALFFFYVGFECAEIVAIVFWESMFLVRGPWRVFVEGFLLILMFSA